MHISTLVIKQNVQSLICFYISGRQIYCTFNWKSYDTYKKDRLN